MTHDCEYDCEHDSVMTVTAAQQLQLTADAVPQYRLTLRVSLCCETDSVRPSEGHVGLTASGFGQPAPRDQNVMITV